jgi:predicted N-acyltransferase
LPDSSSSVRVLSAISEIAKEDWDACANPGWDSAAPLAGLEWHPVDRAAEPPPPDPLPAWERERVGGPVDGRAPYNPFLSYDFLLALEESGSATARTGWRQQHLVLDGDGAARGAMPLYLKSHSMGEYVFDQGWAEAYQRAGGSYYPKLQVSVPFTPVTGPRLLMRDAGDTEGETLLAAAAIDLAGKRRASSVHATFLPEEQWARLGAEGWLRRTDQQFQFFNEGYRDFQDFLAALASRKRKAIRHEREGALAGGVEVEALTGSTLTEASWDAFFDFYMDTGSRKWGRPYLSREFFSLIGESMPDRIVLVIARKNGRPIAGALNFVGSDTLYGRYWGATEPQPFLHFELCYYQAIDWALARGLARVEAGAQGEHKIARGYRPVTTYSAHWIGDPGLRRAVASYLERERLEVAREQAELAGHVPFRHRTEEQE